MARRGGEGTGAGTTPITTLIPIFVGLLMIVIIVVLGPALAGAINAAYPASTSTCKYTNTTESNTYYGRCGTVNATDPSGKFNTAITTGPFNWNPLYNSAIPDGSALWTTNVLIGGIVVLVVLISMAIFYIRVIV